MDAEYWETKTADLFGIVDPSWSTVVGQMVPHQVDRTLQKLRSYVDRRRYC